MASLKPLIILLIMILTIITCNNYSCSLATPLQLSHKTTFKLSTIAAEPTVLPYSPLSAPSPELSPDITPLFPTPSMGSNPPAESSLPIIPSSPSPPNPDSLFTPHSDLGIAPTAASPESSALGLGLSFLLNSSMVVLFYIVLW